MKPSARDMANQLLCMLLLLCLTACSDEGTLHQQEQGYLSLGSIMVDVTTESEGMTRTLTSDPQAPSASDFLVELIDSYGTVIKRGKPQDFTSPLLLFVTTYTIRASFGDAESLISNKPYYYGETTVTVKANETTFAAPISASLQSAMVSADVSALTTHFTTTPKVYLSTSSTKVELSSGSWLYLKPEHNYIMTLEGTNQAGIAVSPTLKSWDPVKKTAYTITATPDLPILTLPDQQAGAWAKRLYITPATATNSLGNPITLPQGTVYEVIPESSSDWSAALTSSTDVNGLQVIKGLNSNTSYKIRARVGTIVSSEKVITTESDFYDIPNKDLEDYCITAGKDGSYYGSGNAFKNDGKGSVYEFWASNGSSWWTTNNDTTCPKSSPYTYSFSSRSGTRPTTDSHSGSAAQIMTIGYGAQGASLTPSSAKYNAIGYLNILKRSFNYRPTGLSFFYKYSAYQDDEPDIHINIYNGEEIIGSGTLIAPYSSAYTQATVSIYYGTNVYTQATDFEVTFASGSKHTNTTKRSGASNNDAMPMFIGSQLFIDDISLIYD